MGTQVESLRPVSHPIKESHIHDALPSRPNPIIRNPDHPQPPSSNPVPRGPTLPPRSKVTHTVSPYSTIPDSSIYTSQPPNLLSARVRAQIRASPNPPAYEQAVPYQPPNAPASSVPAAPRSRDSVGSRRTRRYTNLNVIAPENAHNVGSPNYGLNIEGRFRHQTPTQIGSQLILFPSDSPQLASGLSSVASVHGPTALPTVIVSSDEGPSTSIPVTHQSERALMAVPQSIHPAQTELSPIKTETCHRTQIEKESISNETTSTYSDVPYWLESFIHALTTMALHLVDHLAIILAAFLLIILGFFHVIISSLLLIVAMFLDIASFLLVGMFNILTCHFSSTLYTFTPSFIRHAWGFSSKSTWASTCVARISEAPYQEHEWGRDPRKQWRDLAHGIRKGRRGDAEMGHRHDEERKGNLTQSGSSTCISNGKGNFETHQKSCESCPEGQRHSALENASHETEGYGRMGRINGDVEQQRQGEITGSLPITTTSAACVDDTPLTPSFSDSSSLQVEISPHVHFSRPEATNLITHSPLFPITTRRPTPFVRNATPPARYPTPPPPAPAPMSSAHMILPSDIPHCDGRTSAGVKTEYGFLNAKHQQHSIPSVPMKGMDMTHRSVDMKDVRDIVRTECGPLRLR
ncbi:hypothetical protein TREMEDRAFT_59621 [Tremella mesenterica DSM 1558]|uniref:uncharacterized protein n=1 Tax=Tremella mesenterica (strain ATCC 24925 / CBS 8224 / DSM 1558 / NBRC 9311 / NRRL Y-6157 / RJB 2259-6 / UBC 559-6) TaxID=578456 RepID=UPI0003F4A458|nr:uncharacterized protein TREMEDRAFT_59621 [Tremella mesenterica DSM 1558]EIW73453.1 hypothetical protein TREMEDRAFT_59621 [Tremella mesenterica DSM 1558]